MNPLAFASAIEDTPRSLAQSLPAVLAPIAGAARLIHDRRFMAWARSFIAGLPVDVASADDSSAEASVRLRVGTSAGSVTLVLPRLASTLSALISDLASVAHLQEQACALASAWLRSLQDAARLPVKVISVHEVLALPAPQSRHPGAPCVFIDGCSVQVLEPDPTLLDEMTQRMAAQTRLTCAAPWLKLRSRLSVGLQALSMDTLRSLAVGDVLLISSRPAPGWLHVGDSEALAAPATLSDTPYRLTLTGPLTCIETEPLPMSADTAATEDLLSQLPLKVSFELDTAEWTLGQLTSMGAGQIVPLQTSPEQAVVRLFCQGRLIGHGQLISLGEHLGVRISQTQWPLDDAL